MTHFTAAMYNTNNGMTAIAAAQRHEMARRWLVGGVVMFNVYFVARSIPMAICGL